MEAESFRARGHPFVRSTHPTTLEITKDPEITPRADCIVAVSADKGAAGLGDSIRRAIHEGAEVYLLLEVGDQLFRITGMGHPDLPLTHPRDMVFRKSNYICPRTVFVSADKASIDLPRRFVKLLRNPLSQVAVTIGTT
jgi:hypothetical protein